MACKGKSPGAWPVRKQKSVGRKAKLGGDQQPRRKQWVEMTQEILEVAAVLCSG
jgi:hypothetical protein